MKNTPQSMLSEVDPSTNTARSSKNGRFVRVTRCDGCGKPVTGTHFTDDRVCGSTDDAGFYICHRVQCATKRQKIEAEGGVPALAAHYQATRVKNDAA